MNLNTSVHGSKCVHWTASTILLEFCMRLNREPVFDSCRDRVVPRDLSRIPWHHHHHHHHHYNKGVFTQAAGRVQALTPTSQRVDTPCMAASPVSPVLVAASPVSPVREWRWSPGVGGPHGMVDVCDMVRWRLPATSCGELCSLVSLGQPTLKAGGASHQRSSRRRLTSRRPMSLVPAWCPI